MVVFLLLEQTSTIDATNTYDLMTFQIRWQNQGSSDLEKQMNF